jgi:hypothetical protein
VQVFSVSIEKLVSETKNNLNENLSFGTILLSEQVSESCSINIFNQFLTSYFVTSTGKQQIIISHRDMRTHQNG